MVQSSRMDRRPRNPQASRNDAIHRAVLAGLLSNIGQKTDVHEYTGARGTRFNIFPGSVLFRTPPLWVMAAELVETTKLYARTVARIQPEWVERMAEHLVKRTYSDPHWNPQTAHVVAYEKVTLYGLVVVPQRPVHYGPIDPKRSREIFIQALTDGEYHPDSPFYRHNLRLIEEIERLEAKSRQRDLLVSAEVRVDFYDSKIPADIYSGPSFEKWRRQAERHNPRVLFMTRRDLMQQTGSAITQDLYPDFILTNSIRIPLEYHLEPGHPADGVTATIPLAALNQVPGERFEWLVPGLLREKITALIKSLPKNLRVNFVPAPEFAQKADETLKPGDGSLLDALGMFLGKQSGIAVPPEAFDPTALMDHLLMNFHVIDESGKQVAAGRNLDELRRKLGVAVKNTFSQAPHPKYHRDDVIDWDFGELPEAVPIKRHGMTLMGYPALVDNGESVSLRLLDSPESARVAHAAGLRRLLLFHLRDEIEYLEEQLPDLAQLCLYYRTLGPGKDLKDDIVGKTINRAFLYDSNVRTPMEFELRKVAGRRHRLLEFGREVGQLAGAILVAYHTVDLQLCKPAIEAWGPAIADIRQQLAYLLPKGFLTNTPDQWLAQFPRYLKAIEMRLQKLATAGHTRDGQRMAELAPFLQGWLERSRQNREKHIVDLNLDLFRWMIEEFRVSLFVQELRTAIPISNKRLEKQWEAVVRAQRA